MLAVSAGERTRYDCGCAELDTGEWVPCRVHVGTPRHKIGKAHGRAVELERCENCGNPFRVRGEPCRQCGVSERIGP